MIDFLKQYGPNILQITVSVALIIVILMQQRGTSLGGTFGGSDNVYRSKRGIEKFLFNTTIVLSVLFVLSSIGNLIIKEII